jgi:epoxide hydrolase-like predicted phosphatase
MTKIKAIIFDAGGVYLEGNFTDFVNKSYKVLGINKTFSTKEEVVFDSNLNLGRVSLEECFRKYFGVPINESQMQEIIELWKTTWKLAPQMEDFVKKLSEKYSLAILSNSDLVNSLEYKKKGWYNPFDLLVLSHEVGILKPDKRIYELTVERLGLPGEACVFIDDQGKNLAPAAEFGMSTILYRNLEQLKDELERIGVKK